MRTNWFHLFRNELKEDMQDIVYPEENIFEKDNMSRAIMKLNTDDRKLILLYYYQELPMKAIAKIIGKTENATIQRINRARKKLKKILTEAGYEN